MTLDDEDSFSRTAYRIKRIALNVSVWFAVISGFTLLVFPVMDIAVPETGLLYQKIISEMGGTTVVVVLGLIFIGLGAWLRRWNFRFIQRGNDQKAQQIMNKLRLNPAAPAEPFYLYLRAFETTGRLGVPLYLRLRKFGTGMAAPLTDDLESYVSHSIRKVAPLIALGHPGETLGAGRILTEEENWKADVVQLMRSATGILLVPSDRPGTLWEIDTLIREGFLNKVVFIMPPHSTGEINTKERWEIARQVMAKYSLEVPDHQNHGLFFEVGPDGRVSNVEPLLFENPREVQKSLRRILSDDPPPGGLFNAVAVADKRRRRHTLYGWATTLYHHSTFLYAAVMLFIGHPDLGFNPNESWATVMERDEVTRVISNWHWIEDMSLAKSEQYRKVEAQTPTDKIEEVKAGLSVRGMPRLDNDNLKKYYIALGDMLARVDSERCASISKGEADPTTWRIAFTYMPPNRIHDFLRTKMAALLAEVEGVETPRVEAKATEQAFEQLLASLDEESRQRFERVNTAPGTASNEDWCWFNRTLFGSPGSLDEPHASTMARTMAIWASDSTAPRTQATETTTNR